MTTEKRMAIMYDGDVDPGMNENPHQPVLWRDTSGAEPVLKMHNKANTAWLVIEADEATTALLVELQEYVDVLTGKLDALDAAATDLELIGTDLDETVAKTDIDDAGTIDGTEIAAALSAMNVRINEVAGNVNVLVTALTDAGTTVPVP